MHRKGFAALCLLLAALFVLAACKGTIARNDVPMTPERSEIPQASRCVHDWVSANCQSPMTCRLCGEVRGTNLPGMHFYLNGVCRYCGLVNPSESADGIERAHSWIVSSKPCAVRMVCKRCGEQGALAAHNWAPANCRNPKKCRICGAVEGGKKPDNHVYLSGFCKYCGAEQKESVSGCVHERRWPQKSCAEPRICRKCGVADASLTVPHRWTQADCHAPKSCQTCGKVEGGKNPNVHVFVHDFCKYCGVAREVAQCDHDWVYPANSCVEPIKCSKCGAERPVDPPVHNWAPANCQSPMTCRICGATEGEKKAQCHVFWGGRCMYCGLLPGDPSTTACPHDWLPANCKNPKTCRLCAATEGESDPRAHVFEGGMCKYCGKVILGY